MLAAYSINLAALSPLGWSRQFRIYLATREGGGHEASVRVEESRLWKRTGAPTRSWCASVVVDPLQGFHCSRIWESRQDPGGSRCRDMEWVWARHYRRAPRARDGRWVGTSGSPRRLESGSIPSWRHRENQHCHCQGTENPTQDAQKCLRPCPHHSCRQATTGSLPYAPASRCRPSVAVSAISANLSITLKRPLILCHIAKLHSMTPSRQFKAEMAYNASLRHAPRVQRGKPCRPSCTDPSQNLTLSPLLVMEFTSSVRAARRSSMAVREQQCLA
jgi:hypothetical protein